MLSDISPDVKSPKRRAKDDKRARYADSQKTEALKLWLICGNLATVSATLDIGYKTLQSWRYSQWWEDLANELKKEGRIKLNHRLKTIASKALDEIEDRLENGDIVILPTGELSRRKVSAQIAHRIASDFVEKSIDIEDNEKREIAQEKVVDRLQALAEAFTRFSKKDAVEADYRELYAIPIERETQLQSGSGMGEEAPREASSESSPDAQPQDNGESRASLS